jgi:hypothetical protein
LRKNRKTGYNIRLRTTRRRSNRTDEKSGVHPPPPKRHKATTDNEEANIAHKEEMYRHKGTATSPTQSSQVMKDMQR